MTTTTTIPRFIFVLLFLSTTSLFNSCKVDDVPNDDEKTLAIEQMKSILYEKYDITVNYLGQDSFEFIYPDEKILKIEKNNDSEERIISGSRINNEEFSINFKNSIIDFENMEILETNGSKVSYEDFILRISPNSQTARPCSQYPSGVTFSSCFQTEMSEFCDGVIGCIAILVVPRELAVAFTIHCTRCVAQNSENPDTGLE